MHLVVYVILFAWTVYVMQRHGFGRTFAWCLLPAVLLVNFAKSVSMPLLPNLTSLTMVLYGVGVGLLFRWKDLRKIRWNMIDTMMVLILIPIFVTSLQNGSGPPPAPGSGAAAAAAAMGAVQANPGDIKFAQRNTMEFGCLWLFPYFMARIALQEAEGRRSALRTLCALSIFIGCLTALESSGLRPNITARVLYRLNLNTTTVGRPDSMVFKRFGMARAIATAGQQIDLGNVGVLVGTMILVLIPASGSKWTSPLSVGGILGAGAMVVGSVSMTSWAGMFVAFVCYALFNLRNLGKYAVVPILIAELAFMVLQSRSMLNEDNPVDRPGTDVGDSKWIRVKIMQDAWPLASTAGAFGFGPGADVSHIGVGSVDNSYLLFIIQTGWVSLAIWLSLLGVAAIKGAKALGRVRTASERLPLSAMIAGILAIAFSMYTVFFGFCYAILFAALFGLLSSMCQLLARQPSAAAPAVSLHGGFAPHDYPAMAGGGR